MARTQYFERNRKTITKNETITMTTEKTIKYFSMFSGIGGFERGIEKADTETSFECVGYSEIDNYAVQIYEKHYPNHPNYGDARLINTKDLPSFEFLVGGFPCQAFSIAGNKRGFNDTRGTLFFEIARVLQDCKPQYFLLENVKNLLYHRGGETFQTILEVCDDLGYDVSWEIYNSKDYGIPQSRQRLFLKGYFRELCGDEILSSFRKEKTNKKTINKKVKVYGGVGEKKSNNGTQWYLQNRVFDVNGISPSLTTFVNGYLIILKDNNNKKKVIRKLTPMECERLQGFTDNWTRYGKDGELISDSQRYKCLGNAVTTNVITAIIEEMFP